MLAHGDCESLKGSIHVALGLLAITCALYNAAAWLRRREPHLWVNSVIYAALVGLECRQVQRHHEAWRTGHG